jgi:hypothetical protein
VCASDCTRRGSCRNVPLGRSGRFGRVINVDFVRARAEDSGGDDRDERNRFRPRGRLVRAERGRAGEANSRARQPTASLTGPPSAKVAA